MIYPAEADIVIFLKLLSQSLQPYAAANDVHISFSSAIKKQVIRYHPFLLSQSLLQLICNIINLLPPKNKIKMRVLYSSDHQHLLIEIENTGIHLIRVNEVSAQTAYSFTGFESAGGTIYRLLIPLQQQAFTSSQLTGVNGSGNNLPKFYREIQKRLSSHFTQTEKLIATLEQHRPQEAAFMQKINALINVNLENEHFDTNALCKAMSLSRTQLFRRLKYLIKLAPAHHIKAMRLKKAKELLETTDCTISEITFRTGFQNISHFTKIFKKEYTVTPSVFRRSNAPATNE
ncbi:MAG: response regulator [Ferruginibacter sp.]|nr:response regulator [Ferruginibacter sp.]